MSQHNVVELVPVGNLFVWAEGTETSQVLTEALGVLRRCPAIQAAIEADQDRHGCGKKKLRLEEKFWACATTPDLPGVQIRRGPIEAGSLRLAPGRPRMAPEVVYVFLVMRGLHGSVTDRDAVERLRDSMTVRAYVAGRNVGMPGATTILENLNVVSNPTRELILEAQIGVIGDEGLDDFARLTLDSTAVAANSAWPNDAGMMWALLARAYHYMGQLPKLGLPEVRAWHCPRWLKEIKGLAFQINTAHGKKERKRRKLYRQLLDRGAKVVTHLADQYRDVLLPAKRRLQLSPRLECAVRKLWERIGDDLAHACRVYECARRRVLEGQTVAAADKVLSLADPDAAFIQKGGREPVIGYKPQLGRSRNGFVTALRLSQGNTADATELVPLVRDSVVRTGVVPTEVITDDGYASKAGRNELLAMEIGSVVISGSKGRKLTPVQEWDSDAAAQARSDRSAVESLIFTLKFVHEFGQMRRRGLEPVRAEMLEKVIAHNFRRMVQVRSLKAQQARQEGVPKVA